MQIQIAFKMHYTLTHTIYNPNTLLQTYNETQHQIKYLLFVSFTCGKLKVN